MILSGEEASHPEERIKILTPQEFFGQTTAYYDLIVNVDSLTEMDPKSAREYWNRIESVSGMFLSINHEINPFTVKELISERKKDAQIERYPYWMRKGYVEEIVHFLPKNGEKSC